MIFLVVKNVRNVLPHVSQEYDDSCRCNFLMFASFTCALVSQLTKRQLLISLFDVAGCWWFALFWLNSRYTLVNDVSLVFISIHKVTLELVKLRKGPQTCCDTCKLYALMNASSCENDKSSLWRQYDFLLWLWVPSISPLVRIVDFVMKLCINIGPMRPTQTDRVCSCAVHCVLP